MRGEIRLKTEIEDYYVAFLNSTFKVDQNLVRRKNGRRFERIGTDI